MPNMGKWEIGILLIVILVLFGAKRLPDSARSLGRSMRIFKSEMKEMKTDESPSEENDKTEK
jgi:TatA/E family protein of Tat protein translocase